LISGLITKDKKSYDTLYLNYSPVLYGRGMRQLKGKDKVRIIDIVDDYRMLENRNGKTVLKKGKKANYLYKQGAERLEIYKNIKNFDTSKGTLFTWMLNICRNASIDKIRYKKESSTIPIDSMIHNMGTGTNPEIEMANSEIWATLEKLTDEHKELLKLSYYYGYSHSEISKILDMPFGTVKSKIRIAIRELRKIYP